MIFERAFNSVVQILRSTEAYSCRFAAPPPLHKRPALLADWCVSLVRSIHKSIVILPRWVPWVNNVRYTSATGVWDPPAKWTPQFVLQQARHFLDIQQVLPPPRLPQVYA